MKIFVSYAHKDSEFTHKLVEALRKRRHDVWIDDERLRGADLWWEEITRQIAECECFLTVLTSACVDSIYCEAELNYGLAWNKPIMPVIYEVCDVPSALHRYQWINIPQADLSFDAVVLACVEALYELRDELKDATSDRYRPPSERPSQPPVPTLKSNAPGKRQSEVFTAAALAEEQGDFPRAERLYGQVIAADADSHYGRAAKLSLKEMLESRERDEDYKQIVILMENPATQRRGRTLLQAFIERYGVEHDLRRYSETKIEVMPKRVTPPPSAKHKHKPGDRIVDAKGVTMVYVPPTTYDPSWKFMMGSTEQQVEESFEQAKRDYKDAKKEWYTDQMPQHEIVIPRGFWLDLTPVTNAMYADFVNDGGYQNPKLWTEAGWGWVQKLNKRDAEDYDGFTDEQQPRVGVTWYEAYAYCQWRGGRLPTEAEWEWAARGPNGLIYPWGNQFNSDFVIWSKNSGGKSAKVGDGIRKSGASWVGALDMSGNVWEWCHSLYQPYPYNADDGRESNDSTNTRVLRGGSWRYISTVLLRSAYRLGYSPGGGNRDGGFRFAAPAL